ncbi:MAG TPA: hypothetical protein VMW04_01545 [Patescibacteria group bacterium]|nr:hypothetical protein [Patescibacteria group bacterium]
MRGKKLLLAITLVAFLNATLITPLVLADRRTDPVELFQNDTLPDESVDQQPLGTGPLPPPYVSGLYPHPFFPKYYPQVTWEQVGTFLSRAKPVTIPLFLLWMTFGLQSSDNPDLHRHTLEGERADHRQDLYRRLPNRRPDDCLARDADWYDGKWHSNAVLLIYYIPGFKSGNRSGGIQFVYNKDNPDRSTCLAGVKPPPHFHCSREDQQSWCPEAEAFLMEVPPTILS